MQKILIEKPYQFIPPYRGKHWSWLFRFILPQYLKASHGIVSVECRGLDRLKRSVAEGFGVLLTPNHCRLSDPMTMGAIVRETNIHLYTMASWHLFNQDGAMDRLAGWMMRRLGAFSIFREGTDRTALNVAIDILATAERPLVIYPEGTVNRANDRLGHLMDGVTFIARAAAKKAKKNDRPGVVAHPVALRYVFLDNAEQAVDPVLTSFEQRLTLRHRAELTAAERVERITETLLSIKEVDQTGCARTGNAHNRRLMLIEEVLQPIEQELFGRPSEEGVVHRVKEIRTALLARLLDENASVAEKSLAHDQLADAYLAQQMHFYPEGYLAEPFPPEHLVESVERLEEDLTDRVRVYGRMKVIMEIGEPITVATERDRNPDAPTLIDQIECQLRRMLEATGAEVAESRSGVPGRPAPVLGRDLTTGIAG